MQLKCLQATVDVHGVLLLNAMDAKLLAEITKDKFFKMFTTKCSKKYSQEHWAKETARIRGVIGPVAKMPEISGLVDIQFQLKVNLQEAAALEYLTGYNIVAYLESALEIVNTQTIDTFHKELRSCLLSIEERGNLINKKLS